MVLGTLAERAWAGGLAAACLATALSAGCAKPKPAGPAARLDFALEDPAGRQVRLADFKGRPMIVNFWATYCVPCKAEMPELIELSTEFQSRRLAVLGISVGDTGSEIQTFQAEFPQKFPANYPLLVGMGHDDLLAAYNADVFVPVTWLIRADGTIATKAEGPQTKAWFETQLKAMF